MTDSDIETDTDPTVNVTPVVTPETPDVDDTGVALVVIDQPAVTQALSTPLQIVPAETDTNYPAVLGFSPKDPGLPK